MVPAQRLAFGVQIRNAIANSSTAILVIAIATVIAKSIAIERTMSLSPLTGFLLAGGLIPGALIGAWFGAGLTHRLPVQRLRVAFQILLAVAGLRLMWA